MVMNERIGASNGLYPGLARLKHLLLLATATVTGLAAGGAFAANCSISTVPSPAVITEGQSVEFSGSVSGKRPRSYDWTFEAGTPSSSSQQTVTVSYAAAGSYTATLDGANARNENCSASVTVTVNAAGGNNPPVDNDDSYSTNQDTPLNQPAPNGTFRSIP